MDEHLVLVINTSRISNLGKIADALNGTAEQIRSGVTDGVISIDRDSQIGWFLIH